MQTILTLEDKDIIPNAAAGQRDNYQRREAARAVVTDRNGAVALMHSTKHNYHKLPGGGIDEDEEIIAALHRELLEEIGCKVIITDEIGKVVEYRDSFHFTQISYAYLATLNGKKGTPNLTDKEIADGFEAVWVENIELALELVNAGVDRSELGIAFMNRRDAAILQAAQNLT